MVALVFATAGHGEEAAAARSVPHHVSMGRGRRWTELTARRTLAWPVLPPTPAGALAEEDMHRILESEVQAVVVVEGISDRIAVEALAVRRGRDLAAEGVAVVAVGGAHRIGRFLGRLRLARPHAGIAGLCDAGEERHFRRAVERTGLGTKLTRTEMERLGFYVCVPDLEAELIRALGAPAVETVLAMYGDLAPFRTLQNQLAWRGRPVEEQLRRFMGSGGRRKLKYARLLVEALDPARVPKPLDGVLVHVERFSAGTA